MHWKGWDTRGSKSELAGEEDVESLKELVLQDCASEEILTGWQRVRDAGTPNPESSTCLPSSHRRSSLDLCLPPSCPAPVVRRPFSLGGRRSDSGCVRWAGRQGRANGWAAPAGCHKGAVGCPRATGRQASGMGACGSLPMG